ncbi:MAG: ATP-binding protein [Anaerolineales bacterium]|nr:cell wall metabolism sensor histidine kinase WalK [Anaerolineales bacterium]MCS7247121.1 cell wall metabolism sensor histidine kinase WalK [Anaerolineales bacterium]MDW8160932.1 ATP-binding protein [Anaerolineales bacterium]MDW8446535.1 ATP-binding protein [Anaerolineales bacterium]
MSQSLRSRIAIPLILVILGILIPAGVAVTIYFNRLYTDSIYKNLLSDARLIASLLADQKVALEQVEVHAWSDILGERITIIDLEGTVIHDSHKDPTQMENHLQRPEIQQAIKQGVGFAQRYSETLGIEMVYVAVPIRDENQQPRGYVRVALPLSQLRAEQRSLQGTILGSLLLMLFLISIVVINVARHATRPIEEITRSIAKLSSGGFTSDWKPKLSPAEHSTEVDRLIAAFDYLTAKIHDQIQALEQERNKISAVLQEMTDGVLIIDPDGVIQLANPAVARMLNLAEPNLVGKTVSQVLFHPQFYESWQKARGSKETQTSLIEVQPRKLYIQCTTTPLETIAPGTVLMLLQNLTRQRYLETVRRDFISNISHELRTPLASLKALTETLQEGALEDPPAARKFLMQIETEVDSLSHMVSELLELSRIESGQVPLRLKPSSPYEILQKAVERLGIQAERAGLKVIIDCDPNVPPVLADPSRLEQVVGNLFHNAIKFTPAGGQIVLSAKPQNGKILFCVADTGIGIPAEDLPRIFERFYKTDRARASGGTGLGLAIAKHVVEAHGGTIWAESIESQGSKFYFWIPTA